MPAPIPTDAVRTQSERKASPTARGPWPRSQSETTPTTTRNGVALNGRTPANPAARIDRKSTRLNSSHDQISYAVFCLKKKKKQDTSEPPRSRRPQRDPPTPNPGTDVSTCRSRRHAMREDNYQHPQCQT